MGDDGEEPRHPPLGIPDARRAGMTLQVLAAVAALGAAPERPVAVEVGLDPVVSLGFATPLAGGGGPSLALEVGAFHVELGGWFVSSLVPVSWGNPDHPSVHYVTTPLGLSGHVQAGYRAALTPRWSLLFEGGLGAGSYWNLVEDGSWTMVSVVATAGVTFRPVPFMGLSLLVHLQYLPPIYLQAFAALRVSFRF